MVVCKRGRRWKRLGAWCLSSETRWKGGKSRN